jgi:hypothetical protein
VISMTNPILRLRLYFVPRRRQLQVDRSATRHLKDTFLTILTHRIFISSHGLLFSNRQCPSPDMLLGCSRAVPLAQQKVP